MTQITDDHSEPVHQPPRSEQGAAGLARTMLDAETGRRALQIEEEREMLFADELLPGVGGGQMTLRQGVKVGGVFAFVMLLLIQSFDELESTALSSSSNDWISNSIANAKTPPTFTP